MGPIIADERNADWELRVCFLMYIARTLTKLIAGSQVKHLIKIRSLAAGNAASYDSFLFELKSLRVSATPSHTVSFNRLIRIQFASASVTCAQPSVARLQSQSQRYEGIF